MITTVFTAKSSATSITIRLTPKNNDDAPLLAYQGTKGQEHIYTYIEAVNCLLNSYATADVVAKAASEIEPFKKYNNQTAVQFADARRDKAL